MTGTDTDGRTAVAGQDIPLIHIGFYKTASSWLQKYLFTPELGYDHVTDTFSVHRLLVRPQREDFAARVAVDALSSPLQGIVDRGHVPVISCEALSGDLLRGGYNRWQNADRLRQVFGRARILLVVREQRQLIRSMYKTLVLFGLPYSLKGLLQGSSGDSNASFDLDFIRFDTLAQYYSSLYGAGAVRVLPYELFRQQPAEFLKLIAGFCGHQAVSEPLLAELPFSTVVNQGESLAYIQLQRWINRLTMTHYADYAGRFNNNDFEHILRRIAWHKRHARETVLDARLERRFVAQVEARLAGVFADSNRRLQAFCPVELESFAYDM